MSCSQDCECRPGVVALVFIPGIMGTRLKNAKSGDSVWDPAAGLGDHESGAAVAERAARTAEMDAAKSTDDDGSWESLAKWFERRWIDVKSGWDGVEEFGRQTRRKLYVYPRISDLIWAGPAGRKSLLVGKSKDKSTPVYKRDDGLLEIDRGTADYFEVYTSVPPAQVEDKKARGWGEVHWDSYGGFLNHLETVETLPPEGGEDDTLKKKYPGLRFPVYAIGYNWMLSNEKAGDRIKDRLAEIRENIVAEDERGISASDVKIVMITHSMGGYAARSAFALSGAESDVEAVIHGAMPTNGSPATYKQMRAGQSGIKEKLVLGKNAADTTAILGFCQGGLELLPNQLYRNNDNTEEWLFLETGADNKNVLDIGYGKDISNFYINADNWYSMIQTQLLAPELKKEMLNEEELFKYLLAFREEITDCSIFNGRLADNFHATTTLIYSTSSSHKAFDRCVWVGDGKPDGEVDEWSVNSHENHAWFFGDGTIKLFGPEDEARFRHQVAKKRHHHPNEAMEARVPHLDTVAFTIAEPSAPGDGTVHEGAGKYPTSSGGIKKLPLDAKKTHQDFFNGSDVRKLILSELQSCLPDIHAKLGG